MLAHGHSVAILIPHRIPGVDAEAYSLHIFLKLVPRSPARKQNLGEGGQGDANFIPGLLLTVSQEAAFSCWPLGGASALVRWAKLPWTVSGPGRN